MKKSLLSIIIGLSVVGAAVAQSRPEVWTLKSCIDFAQQNNTTVRTRAVQVDQNSNDLSTARFSRLPDLNASVGYNVSFGRGTSDDNTYKTQTLQTGSFDVSASMPLFQGLRINRTIKGGKLDLAAAMQDLERAREDVAVNVMTLYLQVLYNKELVIVAEHQLALSTQQAERSRELVAAGKQPESARYESEALAANDALALTQARNDLQLALLDLSQAMNRESADGFDIASPDLDPLLNNALSQRPDADAIYDYAAENRPHIRAERIRLESSENAIAIARSSLYPSLSLRGGYGTGIYSSMDSDFWPQFRHNSSEFVGVSLSIPIFNRRTVRGNIRSAQLSAQRQQLALLDAEQSLRKAIEQAGYNTEAASAKYRAAVAALAAAETAFAYEEQKAAAGRSTVFDFNDAKTRMEKAQSELVQSKFELVFRRKILDYYHGEPLTL
ncbi:MAG: TolC family protein [Alistipes sp.]|nr:TolC family protein [Alistipes sp.]